MMRADDHSPGTRIKGGDGTGRRIVAEIVAAIPPPSMQRLRSAATTDEEEAQTLALNQPISLQRRSASVPLQRLTLRSAKMLPCVESAFATPEFGLSQNRTRICCGRPSTAAVQMTIDNT
jgi:hypothetical protein